MKLPENWLRVLLTSLVVLVAVVMLLLRYRAYLHNPWTRDGQVRANVIQIAARVSGPIVSLPIVDNQFVQAGEPLFEIDPRTYRAALAEAEANLDRTRDQLQNLTEQVKATEAALAQSGSRIDQARSAIQSAQAQLVQAEADYDRATRLVERGNLSRRSLDEALGAQPPEVREFLALTALLERFCAPLCDYLLADRPGMPDSRAMLDRLYRANLFLFSLSPSGGWYRYHHLFREWLLAHFQELGLALNREEIWRRAGRWYAMEGFLER